ncbi:MAG: sulfopyruvate decarboxylase [Candidatus Tectomicrobia bacterium]|nr:sulfopyruvate decarboxylase [Candidatus Tectomicrobia bacterium]
MKEGCADLIVESLKEAGVSIVCTLPESYLKEVFRKVSVDPDFEHVPVTNEGEGASIAAGVWLTGRRAALIMENSGLRMATESLARLGLTHGIPVVMLMSYRGDVGEDQWYAIPHGITMEPLLQALRIPYVIVRKEEEIRRAIHNAYKTADTSKYHVAVVFSGELVQ